MADDEVTIRVPKSLTAKTVKRVIAEADEGRSSKKLQRHLHDVGDLKEVYYLKAEVAYLTDPLLRPPDHFYPLLRGTMKVDEYRDRLAADRWEGNREKIRAASKAELVRRVSSQIIREQVKEAEEVGTLRQDLLALLKPTRDEKTGKLTFQVQPRSLEGCVKAFKEVSILLQMYRQTVLQQIEPHAPTVVDEDQATKGPFTDEEAGQIATQLLKKRFDIADEE